MTTLIEELPHGLHLGIHHEAYHQPVLGMASSSAITRVLRSPEHYRTWLAGEDDDGAGLARPFGRAFHCATLEPECFAETYAVAPDFGDCRANQATGTTKEEGAANKARRAAWREANAGREELSAADWTRALGMAESIARRKYASKLLRGGHAEVTLRWREEETGLECRARADYYLEDIATVVDLKTCESAEPWHFLHSSRKYGYARQETLYRRGFSAIGKPLDAFVFLCVEKRPPYGVRVYSHSATELADGEEGVRHALATLSECMSTGEWPGYDETITEIGRDSRAA